MKIAFEAPIANTEQATRLGDYIFAIAPMFRYPEYKQIVLASGKEIYLDNGTYEGKLMDNKELLDLCFEIRPKVVVLPDVIGDDKETIRLSEAFLNDLDAQTIFTFAEPMGVIQGPSFKAMDTCHTFFMKNQVQIIGLGLGAFHRDGRLRIQYYYQSQEHIFSVHLLGAANIADLCFWQSFADTADTSLPFHLAQLKQDISGKKIGKLDWTKPADLALSQGNVAYLRWCLDNALV